MGPIRYGLLLFCLGCGEVAGAHKESAQVVRATESNTVILPCTLGGLGPTPASNALNLIWQGPLRTMVMLQVNYHYPEPEAGPDMDWGLLIHNISRQDGTQVTCSGEGNPGLEVPVDDYSSEDTYDDRNPEEENDTNYSSSGNNSSVVSVRDETSRIGSVAHTPRAGAPLFRDFAQDGTPFPCNGSEDTNHTWTAVSWTPHNLTEPALSMRIWQVAPYRLQVGPDSISLLLPFVTSRDAGNYSCRWENQSQHFWLEVSARSTVWWHFGKQHWIIWSVALGYVAICLGCFFGFLRFQRAFRAHRQKKKKKYHRILQGGYLLPLISHGSLVSRKLFHTQRDRAPVSVGIPLLSANGDGKEQGDAFSYENVCPRGRQLSLQKGNTLPTAATVEVPPGDEDEEYECPDSEIEQKSDDEDNYENTQEEVKQEDVALNDGSPYENSKKGSCGPANAWYVNPSQRSLQDLAQDPVSEDADNYENVEMESSLSPGAARLIAGLRLHLALDPQVDKQDGGSEASTGSQSYEEMNATLSPTPSKVLHTSNEEDADSYENMESPNSLNLWKESYLDPQGEGSVRQNLSVSFGTDLGGGL
ncbi:B-lymphocyte antigen CD19 [Paroedura picta]|uniref:B-lymphocyte antigen CD19 n=1 Tax=Paroedura picta TaxID=143630 RepID=UPI0040563246